GRRTSADEPDETVHRGEGDAREQDRQTAEARERVAEDGGPALEREIMERRGGVGGQKLEQRAQGGAEHGVGEHLLGGDFECGDPPNACERGGKYDEREGQAISADDTGAGARLESRKLADFATRRRHVTAPSRVSVPVRHAPSD